MQPVDGRPIARNPMLLAEFYLSGLNNNKWKTQKEAVAALGHLKPSINREHLSRAVGVSKLPQPVRALFQTTGIWTSTARELLRLAKKYGIGELEDRAKKIDPGGLTWHQIVKLLDGQEPVAPSRRSPTLTPLALAAIYQKGLAEARWDSMTGAAKALGSHKTKLMRAVAISKLPPEVLQLFEGKTLLYANGDVLLKIHQAIGTAKMEAYAKELLKTPKRRSAEQIVAHLMGVRGESGLALKIRKVRSQRVTRFVFEFSVEAPEAAEIIAGGEDMAPIIKATLVMLQTKQKARRERSHES